MKNPNKILALAGLAARAGKTVSGEFSTEKAVKTGKARVVMIASDASANTLKKFTDMCTFYQVPLLVEADKEELGRAIGKEYRASLAVLEEHIAEAIMKEADRERSK